MIFLFMKTSLNTIENTSSSSSSTLSLDKEWQAYFFLDTNGIKTTGYFIPWEIFFKWTAVINICLKINRYWKTWEFCKNVHINLCVFSLPDQKLELSFYFEIILTTDCFKFCLKTNFWLLWFKSKVMVIQHLYSK